MKKLTAPQEKVVNYLKLNGSTYDSKFHNLFNRKTIDNMLSKGIIERTSHERLRTDDMEMVYWYEYRIVSELNKALE
jgi:hypothetical protein